MTVLDVEGVSHSFDSGAIVALRDVTFSVARGERIAVVGRSGSGKSTLVNVVTGLMLPTKGTVRFDGRAMARLNDWTKLRADSIGLVFQHFHLVPTLTAAENIELALFGRTRSASERRQVCGRLIDEMALAHCAHQLPGALSGGERQRTAIARALAIEPKFIVADEPTGNLDEVTGQQVCSLILRTCQERNAALLLVTHDPQVASLCSRRIELRDGAIARDTGGGACAS
jgi:ABC-type lipoprotein export system ATPase subunit